MLRNTLIALCWIFTGLFLCTLSVSCGQTGAEHDLSQNRVLNRGNGPEPESLDPQLARSESALTIVRDLYEGLLTRNEKGELVAGAAERWTFHPDDQCYRFYLRNNLRWASGEQLTAEDFIRGFRFAINPKNASPYAELLKPINNADQVLSAELPPEAIDIWSGKPDELNICMQGQSPPYALELFALPVTYPRHAGAGKKKQQHNGAYFLADRVAQEKIVLRKNSEFHAHEKVFFDEIQYMTTEDAGSELKRYLAGDLDITVTIPPNEVERLRKSDPDAVRIAPVLNTYFYGFNQSIPPFKDKPDLRRALSLVIDKKTLAERVLGTGEIEAWNLLPPGIGGSVIYEHPDAQLSKLQRISLARELYADAGYSDAEPLKIELRFNTSPLHRKIAVAIAAMWKEHLGVQTELHNEEWKVFVQSRRQRNTQVFRSGWLADVNDASNYLDLFTTGHPLNDYGYSSSRFDELMRTATAASSKRPSILRAAEQELLNDYAIIPLYFYVSKHMVRPEIQGWNANILDIHPSQYLYLDEDK